MTISHRADVLAAHFESLKSVKVKRMACCCKLSDLLPLVQQLHREAARTAEQEQPRSEAA